MLKWCIIVLFLSVFRFSGGRDSGDNLDRHIIVCRTTDFECFKRQYLALKDGILLGCPTLGIEFYTPYYLRYGNTDTCIRLSGFEESQLVGISMDSGSRFLTLTLQLPLKLQQILLDNEVLCSLPEHEFPPMPKHTGSLKRFQGNATIRVTYPYNLRKRKGQMYMSLGEEGVDVDLDIADMSDFKNGTEYERKEYEKSEWAYEIVRHMNPAECFALPYTNRLHSFTERIPMERYILLYPEEEYTDIYFKYSDDVCLNNNEQKNLN